jgi:hypothetical protein
MAQSGFQTQLVYGSLTPGAVPSALVTNLSGVEIAINAADGKLFYKDTAGNIRVLADVNSVDSGDVAITGGTIEGTPIGMNVAADARFNDVSITSLTLPAISGLLKSSAHLGVASAVPGVDYVSPTSLGVANGVATLNSLGQVPISQLPPFVTGALFYGGTWDADTNTPVLSSSVGTNGVYYKVRVAGSTNLNGNSTWNVGDTAIFSSTKWERIEEGAAPVQSVNGMTGNVTIDAASIGAVAAGANSSITSLSGLTTALSVSQGGTGVTSITGLLKGNGTSAFSSAVAGTDYAIPPTGATGQLLANNGIGGFQNITVGAGLLLSSGTLSATSTSSGSVTSVNVSGGTTGLSFTGGPVTLAGTMTMTGTLGVANGGTGATSRQAAINALAGSTLSGTYLRANGSDVIMSGIQASDIPTLNQDTTGTASAVTNPDQPAITSLGTLTSLTVAGPLQVDGPVLSVGNPGVLGQVLTSSGNSGPPIWTTPNQNATNGTVTSVNISGSTTGLTFGGGPITGSGTIVLGGVLSVTNGGTGTTTSTGSGGIVKENAPVINGASLFNGEANNLMIGAVTPASGAFTSVTSVSVTTGSVTTESIDVSGANPRISILGDAGTEGQVLVSGGASNPPQWATAGTVSSVNASGGTTGLSFTGGPVTTNGTLTLSGTLGVTNGGTGATTATGSGAVVLANSPTLITPNLGIPSVLNLAHATNLPIENTTGILSMVRGGTGATSLSGMIKGDGSALSGATPGIDYAPPTTGTDIQLLANDGAGGFNNVTLGVGLELDPDTHTLNASGVGSVSSVNVGGGTTGLVFMGGPITSSGVLVMEGVLAPKNGGTGAASLSGLIKGNGDSPATAAIAGEDYAPATTATTAQLLGGDGAGGFQNVTIGAGLFLANGTLTSVSGVGTVTSVEISGGDTGLTFLGGTITDSGTATLSGRLSVASGGTGTSYVSGLVKGNGASPMTAAVSGVDYAPATTANLQQLLGGNGAGGFVNVDLGVGLSYENGVLNTTGMGPQGNVVSFAGRNGSVVPESGDYAASMVTATPTVWNTGVTVGAQLGNINSGSGAQHIGYTAPSSTVPRSVGSKLNESLSVVDFGADASGGTDSSLAFIAAYDAAPAGSSILIPPGLYQGASGAVIGTKHVTWVAYGYPVGAPPQIWNLPGTVLQHAASSTPKRTLQISKGAPDDGGSGLHIIRDAAFSGGSPAISNSALKVTNTVTSGNTNLERGLELAFTTSASTDGNTALRVDVTSSGSGSVNGVEFSIKDLAPQPAREVSALGLNVSAAGADDGGKRSGLVLSATNVGGGVAVVSNGLRITTSADAVFTNGINLDGEFGAGMRVNAHPGTTSGIEILGAPAAGITISGTPTVGIAVGASTDVGIDLSAGIHTSAALRIRDGAKLSFNAADSSYVSHVAGGLAYFANGSARHQLLDNGDLYASGRLNLTSTAVTNSAGAATGDYLTVLINGTVYKLALLAAS